MYAHIFLHASFVPFLVIPCSKYCCGSGSGLLRDFYLVISESDLFTHSPQRSSLGYFILNSGYFLR
jgi:hypothetical protein